tara:strand:+ start:406 stop:516 length:111 start_codon:yes stop_codon:yes gene_type:complete
MLAPLDEKLLLARLEAAGEDLIEAYHRLLVAIGNAA